MAYTEYTVICDGAVESSEEFDVTDTDRERAWYDNERTALIEAVTSGDLVTGEIYALHHGHSVYAGECSCSQYVTDHHADFKVERGQDGIVRTEF